MTTPADEYEEYLAHVESVYLLKELMRRETINIAFVFDPGDESDELWCHLGGEGEAVPDMMMALSHAAYEYRLECADGEEEESDT